MTIELVTTDGIFALDGGEWRGRPTTSGWSATIAEVLVIDAAHDAAPIVDAINGRRVDGRSCSRTATTITSTPRSRCSEAVDAPILLHPADRDVVGRRVARLGARPRARRRATCVRRRPTSSAVLHTPGHSPGGCRFAPRTDGHVFSGDTLFCGGPGAPDRSYSDEPTIVRVDPRRGCSTLPDPRRSCTPATATARPSAPSAKR